ncbi:hypothetical protein HK099_004850 [Clydaea vesicula]|uniref:Uncharacterized protein n=1 Tax=Clydaea vesicula TaxID=447962 RepID=A0AAD5U189_9FUNG|nr:hypothetical protein HK099_004850 [Clydaea vesicula]
MDRGTKRTGGCLLALNTIISLLSINAAFSMLSINSFASILSVNSAFSIGCQSRNFAICLGPAANSVSDLSDHNGPDWAQVGN